MFPPYKLNKSGYKVYPEKTYEDGENRNSVALGLAILAYFCMCLYPQLILRLEEVKKDLSERLET